MIDKRLVVAGDGETGEEYLAELLDDSAHGHSPRPNPIVRVLRCVRYPYQRCIAHPDTALELPAITDGTVCRLGVIREAGEKEKALLDIPAEKAEHLAIDRAAMETGSDAERYILLRLRAGDIKRKRIMITFSDGDLEYLRRCEEEFSKGWGKYELPEDLDELPGGH